MIGASFSVPAWRWRSPGGRPYATRCPGMALVFPERCKIGLNGPVLFQEKNSRAY